MPNNNADDRRLVILKDVFGEVPSKLFQEPVESEIKPEVKFKPIEEGEHKVRIINPVDLNPVGTNFVDTHFTPLFSERLEQPEQSRPNFFIQDIDTSYRIRIVNTYVPFTQTFEVNGIFKSYERWLYYIVDKTNHQEEIKIWSIGKYLANMIIDRCEALSTSAFSQDILICKEMGGPYSTYNLHFDPTSPSPELDLSIGYLEQVIENSPNMSVRD